MKCGDTTFDMGARNVARPLLAFCDDRELVTKFASKLGKPRVFSVSINQSRADLILEPHYRLGQGRLRDRIALRRFSEIQRLGQREEIVNLL